MIAMQKDRMEELIVKQLTSMSEQDFKALGSEGLAYIKLVGKVDDVDMYAVHAADGSHIASGQDVALLRAIANQQNYVATVTQ